MDNILGLNDITSVKGGNWQVSGIGDFDCGHNPYFLTGVGPVNFLISLRIHRPQPACEKLTGNDEYYVK